MASVAAGARPKPKPKAAPKPKKPRLVDDATVATIVRKLHEHYPEAQTALLHENPLQLLIATILSAQSTDERVNQVTRTLFQKYRTADDFADADAAVFELEIRPTGFFRNKTKLVMGAAKRIRESYDGVVPREMDALLTLPGVARKTANVVLGSAFGIADGVVVDTHIRRLSNRLGLSLEDDPVKIERDLMKRLPREEWIFMGHAVILHGRAICQARKPFCSRCPLASECPRNGVTVSA
jgi:endonuclease-3